MWAYVSLTADCVKNLWAFDRFLLAGVKLLIACGLSCQIPPVYPGEFKIGVRAHLKQWWSAPVFLITGSMALLVNDFHMATHAESSVSPL